MCSRSRIMVNTRSLTYCLLLLLEIRLCVSDSCNSSISHSTDDLLCTDVLLTSEECMDLHVSFSNYMVMDPNVRSNLHKTNVRTSNGTVQGTRILWKFNVTRDVSLVRGFIAELFYDATAANYECRAITFSNRQLEGKEVQFSTYFNFSTPDSMSSLHYLVETEMNDWVSDILETYNSSLAMLKINFDTIFSTTPMEYQVELYNIEGDLEQLVDTQSTRPGQSKVVYRGVQPGSYFVQISIKNQHTDDYRLCPCYVRFGETEKSKTCLRCSEIRKSFNIEKNDMGGMDGEKDDKGHGDSTVTIVITSCVGALLLVLGLSVVIVTMRRRLCIRFSGISKSNKSPVHISKSYVQSQGTKQKSPNDTEVNGTKHHGNCHVISCDNLSRFTGSPTCACQKSYDIFSDSYSDYVCGDVFDHVCDHMPVCSTLSDCMVQINTNYDNLKNEISANCEKLDGEAVSIGTNISV